MSSKNRFRALFFGVTLVLYLVASVNAIDNPAPAELARALATSANDKAVSRADRQAALKSLEEASRLFQNAGEKVEAARILNRIGRLQVLLNKPDDAIVSYQTALKLLRESESIEAEVDSLNGLAEAFLFRKRVSEADSAIQRSLLRSKNADYKKGEASALLVLSLIQNDTDHAVALATAQKALPIFEKLYDRAGTARALMSIGQYYQAMSSLPESKESYEKAIQIWRELDDKVELAGALINQGFIEFRDGNWQAAINYYSQAQPLIDEDADPERMGQISEGLADAFIESGLPEIGLEHAQRGLEYFRRTEDASAVAYGLLTLGRTYYILGRYDEAIATLNEVFASETPVRSYMADANHFLARVYLASGQFDKAKQHLQVALPLFRSTRNPKETGQVLGLMGQVEQQQNKLESARDYYSQALAIFLGLADRVNMAAIYHALGRVALSQGDLNAAEADLHQAVAVTEDLRRFSASSDLTMAFSANVHDRYASYIDCLMRKHRAQPSAAFDAKAFETSELGRGRSLIEMLRATQTSFAPNIDPELVRKENDVRRALTEKENERFQLMSRRYNGKDLVALESEIQKLDDEYKQIKSAIKARYPMYGELTQSTTLNVQQIQQQIVGDDQTLLLEYFLGADHSYVWAVTRTSLKSYELPSETQIEQATKRFYESIQSSPLGNETNGINEASAELSRLILLPVAAELNKSRVIVVPDGALNYVPFQTLPISTDSSSLLLDRAEVINAPSASILGQLRDEAGRRRLPSKLVAAFGDPIYPTNYAQRTNQNSNTQVAQLLPADADRLGSALRDIDSDGDSLDPSSVAPLYFAAREMETIRDAASAGENDFASGFDATRQRLQEIDLAQYSILHIATHGFLDSMRPERSGVLLTTVDRNGQLIEGFVGLKEIYGLRAPVNLVVLSACRTGLGKDVRGEGLVGLTRGFMYAGASSVVASLWKVDDRATSELMKHFYSNMLVEGMTPAAALRAAQMTIRKDPRWSSPYYWAAFTLQGEYHQVLAPPRTNKNAMIAGALFVSLSTGVGLWIHRRRRLKKVAAHSAMNE